MAKIPAVTIPRATASKGKTPEGQMTVKVCGQDRALLDQLARDSGQTISFLVRLAVQEFVKAARVESA